MRRKIRIIITSVLTVIILVVFYFYFARVVGEILYPLEYRDIVKKYANERQLRPNFVAAIIFTESRFHADSTSGVGAQGLMQIMPATGRGIAEQLGEPFGSLYDPDVSIRYGTFYIKQLIDKYGGNTEYATAAYNAGVPRVDRYIEDGYPLPQETVNFVERIKNAEAGYDNLYGSWYSQSESTVKKNSVQKAFDDLSSFVRKLILGD